MASVSLVEVSKVYPGGVKAVDRVSLDVHDRELLVLVGPSGCGKSTTLRMVAGLEDSSSGTIRIGERVVNDVPPKDRNIAMVFQNYALYPHMSVYKNMAFGLHLRYGGWFRLLVKRLTRAKDTAEIAQKQGDIKDNVHEAAQLLGIEHLLHRMPRQLSGGERQRVALGRAMVRQPAVFLFDEPLSNLDARLRAGMRGELKQLHQRLQATMIYVTHDQVEAMTLGERIVVMDQGIVQQVGSPMEVYDRPRNRFVAGFLGSPPMNFLDGRLAAESGTMRFVGSGCEMALDGIASASLGPWAGRKVVLGIRPEDVRVAGEEAGTAVHSLAKIEMVEALGDSAVLHLQLENEDKSSPGESVLAKASGRKQWMPRDPVRVNFDPTRVHFFDEETGESLTPAP